MIEALLLGLLAVGLDRRAPRALAMLAEDGTSAALLAAAAGAPADDVRAEAAVALLTMGHPDLARQPLLTLAHSGASWVSRNIAVFALPDLGAADDVTAALRQALRDPDRTVRLNAAAGLVRLCVPDPAVRLGWRTGLLESRLACSLPSIQDHAERELAALCAADAADLAPYRAQIDTPTAGLLALLDALESGAGLPPTLLDGLQGLEREWGQFLVVAAALRREERSLSLLAHAGLAPTALQELAYSGRPAWALGVARVMVDVGAVTAARQVLGRVAAQRTDPEAAAQAAVLLIELAMGG